MSDPYRCVDCGMDLSLEPWQIEFVLKNGGPVPRPPCPANANGLHRISPPPGLGLQPKGWLREREIRDLHGNFGPRR